MIVYAVIARFADSTVLAEHMLSGIEGNIPQVTLMLLKALQQSGAIPNGARRTFVHRGDAEMALCDAFGGDVQQWTSWIRGEDGQTNSPVEDYYYHLAHEDEVVYLSLTENAGRPSM